MSPTVCIAISRKTRGRMNGYRGPFRSSRYLLRGQRLPLLPSVFVYPALTECAMHRLRTQSSLVLPSLRSLGLRLAVTLPLSLRLSTTSISFCRSYLNADHAAISTIRMRGLVEAIRTETWETSNLFDTIWQKNDAWSWKISCFLMLHAYHFKSPMLHVDYLKHTFCFIDSYFNEAIISIFA